MLSYRGKFLQMFVLLLNLYYLCTTINKKAEFSKKHRGFAFKIALNL